MSYILELLPTVLLVGLALVGYRVAFSKRQRSKIPKAMSVLGGMAAGLLVIWLPFCLGRFLCLLPWKGDGSIWLVALVPFSLFFVESMILLGIVINECRWLRGAYNPKKEWKHSFSDARSTCLKLMLVSTISFVAFWWMLSPADYAQFKGSMAEPVAGKIASDFFQHTDLFSTTKDEIRTAESAKAIPHAAAFAPFVYLVLVVLLIAYRFFRGEIEADYLHIYPDEETTNRRRGRFKIRGGSPN